MVVFIGMLCIAKDESTLCSKGHATGNATRPAEVALSIGGCPVRLQGLQPFNPDFSAWEDKAAFTSVKLVAVEERAVHFDGLSFMGEPGDTLRIYLLLRDSKTGQVREEEFRLRRVTIANRADLR